MSDYTPGPWRVTGNNIRANTEKGEDALIAVIHDHWYNHELEPEEKLANTRLIAAAPELLSALERVVEMLSLPDDERDGEHDTLALTGRVSLARLVISKATNGEEEDK